MITTRTASNQLYPKTFLPFDRAYFSYLGTKPSPHLLAPDPGGVFENYTHTLREKIIPLALLDLAALGNGLSLKLPVLYYESTNLDYVCYRLGKDNRISDLVFQDYEGNVFEADDEEEVEPFEEGHEYVVKRLNKFRKKFLHISPYLPLPKIDLNEARAFYDTEHALWMEAREKVNAAAQKTFSWFGPVPNLCQFHPDYPVLDGDENAFIFIGQFSTEAFGMVNVNYLLFYHPETRTVAQMMQKT